MFVNGTGKTIISRKQGQENLRYYNNAFEEVNMAEGRTPTKPINLARPRNGVQNSCYPGPDMQGTPVSAQDTHQSWFPGDDQPATGRQRRRAERRAPMQILPRQAVAGAQDMRQLRDFSVPKISAPIPSRDGGIKARKYEGHPATFTNKYVPPHRRWMLASANHFISPMVSVWETREPYMMAKAKKDESVWLWMNSIPEEVDKELNAGLVGGTEAVDLTED